VLASRRGDVLENIHGVEIADHCRWPQDGASAETRAWIAAQEEYASMDEMRSRCVEKKKGRLVRPPSYIIFAKV